MSRRLLHGLALAAVLLAALAVRLPGLDSSYFGDEIFHVVAAQEMGRGHPPRLAPESPYPRAVLHTRAVAAAWDLLGESEWAARLPSLLSGMAAIVLAFLLGARWFGFGVGLATAVIMAFEPQSVHHSTFARFYMHAQALGLLAVYAAARAFDAERGPPARGGVSRPSAWGALALASLALGITLTTLMLDLAAAGVALAALLLAGAAGRRPGRRLAARPEAWVVGLALLGALAALALAPDQVARQWALASEAQVWNRRQGPAWLYYAHALREAYPLAWFLAPVGLLAGLVRARATGLALACLVVVPLALHTFLFAPKSLHYLFPVLPYFFLAAALGAMTVARLLGEGLAASWPAPWRRLAAILLALFVLRSVPWTGQGLAAAGAGSGQDWRAAAAQVRQRLAPGDLVVGGVDDDFLVVRHYLPETGAQFATAAWRDVSLPEDWDPAAHAPGAGVYEVPCWTDAEPVLAALERHDTVWTLFRTRALADQGASGHALRQLRDRASEVITAEGGVTVLRLTPKAPAPS